MDAPPEEPFATGPFGKAELVSISSATARDDDIALPADMLEIFFESDRELAGQSDIYMARRATVNDAWSLPAKVSELSTAAADEGSVEISRDGLTIYFASNRSPSTNMDVYRATRPDRGSPWSHVELVTSISDPNASDYDAQPWSDTVLYLGSARAPALGGGDVFRSTRSSPTADWGTPQLVPGLNSMQYEGEAFADRTGAIWFTNNGAGDQDIWRAEPNGDGTFKPAELIAEICGPLIENDAWVSHDGHTIYFTSTRNGTLDVFMAKR